MPELPLVSLVPKLHLGTQLPAKLHFVTLSWIGSSSGLAPFAKRSFEDKCAPNLEIGNENDENNPPGSSPILPSPRLNSFAKLQIII